MLRLPFILVTILMTSCVAKKDQRSASLNYTKKKRLSLTLSEIAQKPAKEQFYPLAEATQKVAKEYLDQKCPASAIDDKFLGLSNKPTQELADDLKDPGFQVLDEGLSGDKARALGIGLSGGALLVIGVGGFAKSYYSYVKEERERNLNKDELVKNLTSEIDVLVKKLEVENKKIENYNKTVAKINSQMDEIDQKIKEIEKERKNISPNLEKVIELEKLESAKKDEAKKKYESIYGTYPNEGSTSWQRLPAIDPVIEEMSAYRDEKIKILNDNNLNQDWKEYQSKYEKQSSEINDLKKEKNILQNQYNDSYRKNNLDLHAYEETLSSQGVKERERKAIEELKPNRSAEKKKFAASSLITLAGIAMISAAAATAPVIQENEGTSLTAEENPCSLKKITETLGQIQNQAATANRAVNPGL